MEAVRNSPALLKLPYLKRRHVVRTHIYSVVDYATHLCPLSDPVVTAAAQLDRMACSYVLACSVRSQKLRRGRSLARLPSLRTRRELIAMRRVHASKVTIAREEQTSEAVRRARTLLGCNVLVEAGLDAPAETGSLLNAVRAKLQSEWHIPRPGQRPIPTSSPYPPALIDMPVHTIRACSRFYLNTLRLDVWHRATDVARARIRTLLAKNTLSDSEREEVISLTEPLHTPFESEETPDSSTGGSQDTDE